MGSKNRGFAADLVSSIEPAADAVERPSRLGIGVLSGRANRLADLASGSVVNHPQELVDPARCRIWERHNRDYGALNEHRCADLIESIIAQGGQEIPAIVRRVAGDPDHELEVISGARRHWTVSWLRANNYPDIRYLVEIRDLTDEQAFRISDLENRAREDLTDLERARDYLRALELYYSGRQKDMAKRLNVSESWISRYLDLARLPDDLVGAFADPYELKISHIGQLKPLLKTEDTRAAVLNQARQFREARGAGEGGVPVAVPDVIRALSRIAEVRPPTKKANKPPKTPKRTGSDGIVVRSSAGTPIIRIDHKDRRGVTLTLLHKSGGARVDAEAALRDLLDHHWPE